MSFAQEAGSLREGKPGVCRPLPLLRRFEVPEVLFSTKWSMPGTVAELANYLYFRDDGLTWRPPLGPGLWCGNNHASAEGRCTSTFLRCAGLVSWNLATRPVRSSISADSRDKHLD